MALIKCRSCGRDVDRFAKKCPGCGAMTVGSAAMIVASTVIAGALIWIFWLRHFW